MEIPPMPFPRQILIVDDDPAIHDLLVAMLEGKCWDLTSVADAECALIQIGTQSYDLVLADVNLPGMNGLTLLRRISDIRPNIPVVIMTADEMPTHAVQLLRERAFGYLSKPFSRKTITDLITQALSRAAESGGREMFSARPN
jgi:DNA-binding NtrC family response regulator